MEQPEGFKPLGSEHLVCRLKKSLYGLKQAPRAWNEAVDAHLQASGFRRSKVDPCIYIFESATGNITILGLYVDDGLVVAKTRQEVDIAKAKIGSLYEMTDLGPVSHILGWDIIRNRPQRTMQLSQEKYTIEVLKRFHMVDCIPVTTPADTGVSLTGPAVDPFQELPALDVPYMELIGSLMYLVVGTRPDIAQAVSSLCQHLKNPQKRHWEAGKRILRYLQNTRNLKLTYQANSSGLNLEGFCDAAFADDRVSRKSTSGLFFSLCGGAVCWYSKKQDIVTLSATEAEYVAQSVAGQEALFLRHLLVDLKHPMTGPTAIHTDSQTGIALNRNNLTKPRTRHIDVKYHFTRDLVQRGEVVLNFVPGQYQFADALTKPVPRAQFFACRRAMGMCAASST